MEVAIGYTPGALQEADREYERRKKIRDAVSKNFGGGGCVVGGVTGLVLDCAVEGTAPTLMGIPHTFLALGAGGVAGCIVGYGCYKLIKPQNSAQLLRLPVGTEVELSGPPALGTPLRQEIGEPVRFTAEIGPLPFDQGGVFQPPMFQGIQRFQNPMLDAPPAQTMEGQISETTMNPMRTQPGTQSLKKGGLVRRTGLAYVHKGEYVVPTKDINKCNVCNKR